GLAHQGRGDLTFLRRLVPATHVLDVDAYALAQYGGPVLHTQDETRLAAQDLDIGEGGDDADVPGAGQRGRDNALEVKGLIVAREESDEVSLGCDVASDYRPEVYVGILVGDVLEGKSHELCVPDHDVGALFDEFFGIWDGEVRSNFLTEDVLRASILLGD